MERRSFLKIITAGSAAAVNFLYPGLTGVVSAARNSGKEDINLSENKHPEIDPNFAGGYVVERTHEGFVLAAGQEFRAVRLPGNASVWKEFEDVDHNEIKVGDYVDVRGMALGDGSLLAKNAWVNIGRLDGTVEQLMPVGGDMMAQGSRLRVAANKGGTREIEFSSALEVIQLSDTEAEATVSSATSIVPGTKLGAVGLRLPEGGFRATRIWIFPQV